MRIVYIANIRIPTEKAHGVQIVKMCQAFADLGAEVELLVPTRHTNIADDVFQYYGVKENFKILRLPCLDLVRFGRLGFLIETLTFALSVFFHTRRHPADVYYGRDELPLLCSPSPRFWEIHSAKFNLLVRSVVSKSGGIVAISNALKNYLIKNGVKKRILVAHDGVEPAAYNASLPIQGRKTVLYVGHLYKHKGVHTLALAASYLPPDVMVRFVGGTDEDLGSFRALYGSRKNIEIVGHKPHRDIALELLATNVLVLPNSARDTRAAVYTSPMKLFEYMASGVPIVASDVPAIREILDEDTAVLVEPDDPQALAAGIVGLLVEPERGKVLANKALALVGKYTWQARALAIMNFLRLPS